MPKPETIFLDMNAAPTNAPFLMFVIRDPKTGNWKIDTGYWTGIEWWWEGCEGCWHDAELVAWGMTPTVMAEAA